MTAKSVGLGSDNICFANVAIDDTSKLDGDKIEKLSGVFGVNFTVKIPSTAPLVTIGTRTDAIDNAALASLTKNLTRHGAV